jgi:hypothetical protein
MVTFVITVTLVTMYAMVIMVAVVQAVPSLQDKSDVTGTIRKRQGPNSSQPLEMLRGTCTA